MTVRRVKVSSSVYIQTLRTTSLFTSGMKRATVPSQNTSNFGNLQPEDNITDVVDKSFIAANDDPYGSAPVPSPCNLHEVQTNISGISMSTFSNSLGRLEAFGDKGGSGEKRKQSERATPTKDEYRGREVRLESPESDDEVPPRARRVLRHEKL